MPVQINENVKPLVSIIIPTYNRSHLIGDTINSILAQSSSNWECIVVDDNSTDFTEELMEFYCEKDSRIQFHRRPQKRKKGANACRNYGLELSKGKYIQWFDSDDLMVPEFLASKVKAIERNNLDFVISKSINFKDPYSQNILSTNENYYRFDDFKITNYNYVTQKINWLTPDFFGKRTLLRKSKFNENLFSSQEYNFFCKLTCFSENAYVLDEFLTLRRIHPNSIQLQVKNDELKRNKAELAFYFETWMELRKISERKTVDFLFFQLVKKTMKMKVQWRIIISILLELVSRNKPMVAMRYFVHKLSIQTFKKGNIFRRKFISAFNAAYPETVL